MFLPAKSRRFDMPEGLGVSGLRNCPCGGKVVFSPGPTVRGHRTERLVCGKCEKATRPYRSRAMIKAEWRELSGIEA